MDWRRRRRPLLRRRGWFEEEEEEEEVAAAGGRSDELLLAFESLKLTRGRREEEAAEAAEAAEAEAAAAATEAIEDVGTDVDDFRERRFRLPPFGLLLLMGSALKYVDRPFVAADTAFAAPPLGTLGTLGDGGANACRPTPPPAAAAAAAAALSTRSRALRDWRWRLRGECAAANVRLRREEAGGGCFAFSPQKEEDPRLIQPSLFFCRGCAHASPRPSSSFLYSSRASPRERLLESVSFVFLAFLSLCLSSARGTETRGTGRNGKTEFSKEQS
jgi:hypothetical protein